MEYNTFLLKEKLIRITLHRNLSEKGGKKRYGSFKLGNRRICREGDTPE